MERHELIRSRDQLVRKHGRWHDNLLLGDGVYTISERVTADQLRLKAILQAAADALDKPLDRARVLDLGAAEGAFALEFASHGATVVAMEGRIGNVEKIRFGRVALGLDQLEVVQGDVRELSPEKHGEFDLVLCLGLLYHLDGPGAVVLAHRLAEVCRRVAVIDTHVGLKANGSATADGHTYRGRTVREFDPGASAEEQAHLTRSALGNSESLWLTRSSLFNLLLDVGFTSVTELCLPRHEKTSDRVTLLAFNGSPRAVICAPGTDELETLRWPEKQRAPTHTNQTWRGQLKLKLAPAAPRRLKEWARRRRARVGA